MITRQPDVEQTLARGADKNRSGTAPRCASSRRQLLQSAGSVIAIGPVAGCVDDNSQGSDGDGDGKTSVDEWLSNTGNYESIDQTFERIMNDGNRNFFPSSLDIREILGRCSRGWSAAKRRASSTPVINGTP